MLQKAPLVIDGLGFAQKEGIVINRSEFSGGPPRWSVLEHLPCVERLRDWGLFSLGQRWLQWSLTAAPQHLWGGQQNDRAGLFPAVHSRRMRDNGRDLKQERFSLGLRNLFLTLRSLRW